MTVLFLVLLVPAFAAKSETPVNETSAASLEMIAERMKALSGSLAAIPELPQLNQVIQIPDGFVPEQTAGESDNQKETKK